MQSPDYERSFDDGDLWVIREGDEAVAFQVGDYTPEITNVRKDRQRQGYGAALFAAGLALAIRDDVNVLEAECSPRSSPPFWQKHGFVRYGDMGEWGAITVRRVLDRVFSVDPILPFLQVTVAFYPESATWVKDVEPLAAH